MIDKLKREEEEKKRRRREAEPVPLSIEEHETPPSDWKPSEPNGRKDDENERGGWEKRIW